MVLTARNQHPPTDLLIDRISIIMKAMCCPVILMLYALLIAPLTRLIRRLLQYSWAISS